MSVARNRVGLTDSMALVHVQCELRDRLWLKLTVYLLTLSTHVVVQSTGKLSRVKECEPSALPSFGRVTLQREVQIGRGYVDETAGCYFAVHLKDSNE